MKIRIPVLGGHSVRHNTVVLRVLLIRRKFRPSLDKGLSRTLGHESYGDDRGGDPREDSETRSVILHPPLNPGLVQSGSVWSSIFRHYWIVTFDSLQKYVPSLVDYKIYNTVE